MLTPFKEENGEFLLVERMPAESLDADLLSDTFLTLLQNHYPENILDWSITSLKFTDFTSIAKDLRIGLKSNNTQEVKYVFAMATLKRV